VSHFWCIAGFVYHTNNAGTFNSIETVTIGRIIQPETALNVSNFDETYQADFNSTVSMIYEDVFSVIFQNLTMYRVGRQNF